MWKFRVCTFVLVMVVTPALPGMAQQTVSVRDEFFWLGQINKATAVINTDEGLLDRAIARRVAASLAKLDTDFGTLLNSGK